jgi:hypothetical protein
MAQVRDHIILKEWLRQQLHIPDDPGKISYYLYSRNGYVNDPMHRMLQVRDHIIPHIPNEPDKRIYAEGMVMTIVSYTK